VCTKLSVRAKTVDRRQFFATEMEAAVSSASSAGAATPTDAVADGSPSPGKRLRSGDPSGSGSGPPTPSSGRNLFNSPPRSVRVVSRQSLVIYSDANMLVVQEHPAWTGRNESVFDNLFGSLIAEALSYTKFLEAGAKHAQGPIKGPDLLAFANQATILLRAITDENPAVLFHAARVVAPQFAPVLSAALGDIIIGLRRRGIYREFELSKTTLSKQVVTLEAEAVVMRGRIDELEKIHQDAMQIIRTLKQEISDSSKTVE